MSALDVKGRELSDGSVLFTTNPLLPRMTFNPNPSRRSDAMTKYLVMKREARRRDWDRYHVGVVIKP